MTSKAYITIKFGDGTTFDMSDEIRADGNPIYKKREALAALDRITAKMSAAIAGAYGDIDAEVKP